MSASTRTSKFLAYVLRHQPGRFGLALDAAGWAEADALLAVCKASGHPLTRAQLEALVARDAKQRYAFSPDGRRIRASQGHSVPVDLGYQPAVPPATLYHGTARQYLEAIQRQGLHKGHRHHVHLSPDIQTARAVGQRHGEPVVLAVDAGRLHQDGAHFFRSANGVWLVDWVPPGYLSVLPGTASNEA